MSEVNEDDHVFGLANFPKDKAKRVFGVDKNGRAKGVATGVTNMSGGRVAFVDVDYFKGLIDTTIGTTGERSAAHEFGAHMLNLGDTNNPFDLTKSGGNHSNVRKQQLQTIINRQLNFDNIFINRGKSYDVRFYKLTKKKVLNKGEASRIIE